MVWCRNYVHSSLLSIALSFLIIPLCFPDNSCVLIIHRCRTKLMTSSTRVFTASYAHSNMQRQRLPGSEESILDCPKCRAKHANPDEQQDEAVKLNTSSWHRTPRRVCMYIKRRVPPVAIVVILTTFPLPKMLWPSFQGKFFKNSLPFCLSDDKNF